VPVLALNNHGMTSDGGLVTISEIPLGTNHIKQQITFFPVRKSNSLTGPEEYHYFSDLSGEKIT